MITAWRNLKRKLSGQRHKVRKKACDEETDESLEIWECDDNLNYVCGNLWEEFPCEKDPWHSNFISVTRFGLLDLPLQLRHQTVLDYVFAHEKRVVKIIVNKQSEEHRRISNKISGNRSFATGYAWCGVDKSEFPCPLSHLCQCNDSAPGHVAYGGIIVYTNKHVVFDDEEARHTDVEFSFEGKGIVAFGMRLKEDRWNKDLVGLEICSHKPDLYDQISEFAENAVNSWDKIPSSVQEELKNHAIVISHPHGKDKVVSIGDLICLEKEEDLAKTTGDILAPYHKRKVTRYLTATCPGSSGAPVLTGFYPYRPFTHSSADNKRNQNFCMSY